MSFFFFPQKKNCLVYRYVFITLTGKHVIAIILVFGLVLRLQIYRVFSAAAELAEFKKITTFEEKNSIFNEHPVSTHTDGGG